MRTSHLSSVAVLSLAAFAVLAACGNDDEKATAVGSLSCQSAPGPCDQGEVNHDFAQLKEWLEAKVGAVGSARPHQG